MKRIHFIKRVGIRSITLLSGIPLFTQFKFKGHDGKPDAQDPKPPLAPQLVKDFVIAGHGNLEAVKSMLAREPGLLNASWDWGGGDFEEAIEGAAHVGNRDIALYLISKGARMNIFTAAMLGKFEIVKEMINAYPELLKAKGPHGLDLVHHALAGGEPAKSVSDFLQTKK